MSLPGICTITDLQTVTGLTAQRLGQLASEGVIHKDNDTRGRYLTAKSIRGLLQFYKQGSGGKGGTGDLDPAQENAKLNRLKQVQLSDQIKRDRGDWVESTKVEAVYADLVRAIIHPLETLPDILERDAGLTGEQVEQVQALIDQLRDTLHEKAKAALSQ